MIEHCQHCNEVKDKISERLKTSAFGKLVEQCSKCGTLWGIDKRHSDPFVIEQDSRIAPPRNRLAFINDPRRRRPR